tara:strand:+ start:10621 stop:12753 length:2133 start_codon:yes stop_codon:yes gene_type:complete
LLLNPGKGIFDYIVDKRILIGQIVYVPLRNKYYYGIVIGKGSNKLDAKKLKPISEIKNVPPISIELLNFCHWLSEWCMYDISLVTRMIIPSFNFLKSVKNKLVLFHNEKNINSMTNLGHKTFKYIKEKPGLTISDYCKELNISKVVIKKLIKDGNILSKESPFNQNDDLKIKFYKNNNLNQYQLKAVEKVQELKSKSSIFLLDGVTGSGKTEVYISIIRKELSIGKQSLILLPEIALTNQLLEKFEERFGVKPIVWHSELSLKDRHKNWLQVLNGNAPIVIGARSSLFLPFKSLSCIIVDEEHDASYKQDDGVIYNARDMAVVRGQKAAAIVILSSATPSLESLNNAKLGKYIRLNLPERFGNSTMPSIKLIDMRKIKTKSGKWISDIAVKAIDKSIKSKEQVLLFLNRRGYSPLTICKSCGFRFQCAHCSAWLVNHKKDNKMICHFCGYSENIINNCGQCGADDSFISCGPGVERLAEEIKILFPKVKLQILTSDTFTKKLEKSFLNKIITGEINIIIGTQLVAKGHHFPHLNTVVAIDADLGLSGSDLRASEKTFQLLTQLSGRAGRESDSGIAYIQTYDPNHEVMQAILSGDKNNFLEAESKARNSRKLPPYGRLAALIIQSKNFNDLNMFLKLMSRNIPRIKNLRIDVLGPVPAPIPKLRDWHRYRYLIKSELGVRLQPYIKKWLSKIKVNRAIRIKIDIDPYNFM